MRIREVVVDQGKWLSVDRLLYMEVQRKIFATALF